MESIYREWPARSKVHRAPRARADRGQGMKSRTSVLISIVLAMLVASMDSTIMNTTMPIVAEELGRFDLYAWSFAAYMIFNTVLAPVAGRISDLFGRKRVFACGILLFLVGSLLCGLSQSMVQLVIFRAVQGIGAGVMMPFPMIIAGDLFSVENRGKIQALFTSMWGLAAVAGPDAWRLFRGILELALDLLREPAHMCAGFSYLCFLIRKCTSRSRPRWTTSVRSCLRSG